MLWMLCLPTASLFLLLLPCLPAQNGGEKEQSTDVISVWEGDSISITCSMNGSGTNMGMYLRSSRVVKVVYLSMNNPPKFSPDFDGRASCSREGRNYRITLHKLRESDSSVYLCTQYVLNNDHYKILDGKKTIVLVKAKTGGALKQTPLYASPQPGQSLSITCVLNSSGGGEEFYLFKTHVQPEIVLHVSNQSAERVLRAFADRLNYSKEGKKVVITLHNLQESDTDNYVCVEELKTAKNTNFLSATGTMVLVKDAEGEQAYSQQACSGSSWTIYSLLILVALLFSALVCCTLYRVNIKKCFQKKIPNTVYEDMSYSSRRNTLVRTNTFSKAN